MRLARETWVSIIGTSAIGVVLFVLLAIGHAMSTSANERAAHSWLASSLEVSPGERRTLHLDCNTSACQLSWFESDGFWTRPATPRRVTLMCDGNVCVERASPCP